ncbi:hypothetical protein N207_07050 [Helicobacter pylori UM114]|uniref:Uncharacterized protein n=1 Tax=Helicobacter pylori UM114 TaxID=1355531 RepID=T0F563_HELPX|nr:hypothetical protein N207_07050 [Helicobacter pylori UM114]
MLLVGFFKGFFVAGSSHSNEKLVLSNFLRTRFCCLQNSKNF